MGQRCAVPAARHSSKFCFRVLFCLILIRAVVRTVETTSEMSGLIDKPKAVEAVGKWQCRASLALPPAKGGHLTCEFNRTFPVLTTLPDFALPLLDGKGCVDCAPAGVLALVSWPRDALIKVAESKMTHKQREQAVAAILDFVSSPDFRNPVSDIIRRSEELGADLKKVRSTATNISMACSSTIRSARQNAILRNEGRFFVRNIDSSVPMRPRERRQTRVPTASTQEFTSLIYR